MGYERDDRRPERGEGYGRSSYGTARDDAGRSGQSEHGRYGAERATRERYDREQRGRYGSAPQGQDGDDRGFFDRAGDEVRSWFGDDEAERRRRLDERNMASEQGRDRWRGYGDTGGYADYAAASAAAGSGFGPGVGYAPLDDYGAARGVGRTGDRGSGRNRDAGHDPSYRSWRDRQLADLDRDYDEYRREHQAKFESEFGNWRSNRQTQRASLTQVKEHQDVVGSDGKHVGTVDKVRGDRIILTKSDPDAGGHHHSIPSSWLQAVADKVTISKTAEEAQAHWRDEENNSAFGYGDRDKSRDDRSEGEGPRNLNRSFSGTY